MVKKQKRVVTVGIESLDEVERSLNAALRGEAQGEFLTFANDSLLWETLTAKRCGLLRAMAGQGPMSMREAARRVNRDVKAVHNDIHVLLDSGILERTAEGRIEFPYDEMRVNFIVSGTEEAA